MTSSPRSQRGPTAVNGVRDPRRLLAVADAERSGRLGGQGFNAVVATLNIACGVPMAVVNIVGSDLQTYAAEIGVGAPCTSVSDGMSFCAEVVDSGRSLVVADASVHPVYRHNPLVVDGLVKAYAGVPLVDDGFVLGSVAMFDPNPREFTEQELDILQHQAQLASAVLALNRSARIDTLTGLPNRGLYLDRLSQALAQLDRRQGVAAVMYIDVDDFKAVNDTFGHDVGDQVLVELACRLSSVMRTTDTLARFGGDEFVAVCGDLESPRDAEAMAARMLETVRPEWRLGGRTLAVSVSIGIALAGSPDDESAELLNDADSALYRAKTQRGPSWSLSGGQVDERSVQLPHRPVAAST